MNIDLRVYIPPIFVPLSKLLKMARPQIVIGLPVQVKVIAAFLAELSGLPNVAAPGRRNSCS